MARGHPGQLYKADQRGGGGGVNKVTCSRPERVTFTPTTKQQVMFLYFILEASNSTWTYTGSKVHSFLLHCTSWYRLCTRVWRATSSFRQVTDIWSVNPITSLEKIIDPEISEKSVALPVLTSFLISAISSSVSWGASIPHTGEGPGVPTDPRCASKVALKPPEHHH